MPCVLPPQDFFDGRSGGGCGGGGGGGGGADGSGPRTGPPGAQRGALQAAGEDAAYFNESDDEDENADPALVDYDSDEGGSGPPPVRKAAEEDDEPAAFLKRPVPAQQQGQSRKIEFVSAGGKEGKEGGDAKRAKN